MQKKNYVQIFNGFYDFFFRNLGHNLAKKIAPIAD